MEIWPALNCSDETFLVFKILFSIIAKSSRAFGK